MSRQIARRLLAVAFLLGLSAEMLFHGSAAGINVPVVVGLCLVAAWLARRTSAPIDRLDWWIAPTAFGLAAGVALRADDWLVGADIGAALFLTVARRVVVIARRTVANRGGQFVATAAQPSRFPAVPRHGKGQTNRQMHHQRR